MSELDRKRALVEHYKALANRANDPDQQAHYDREFERAAREYNREVMRTRNH